MAVPSGNSPDGARGWLKRATETAVGQKLKRLAGGQLRQLPCLHSVFSIGRSCWRRTTYQTLEQDEEGDGAEVEDCRQRANLALGVVLLKVAMLCMVGITILLVVRNGSLPYNNDEQWENRVPNPEEAFKRDSPIVLYIGALELLVCGACAHTAALMYRRRRHALRHPADSSEKEQQRYIKVHLEKDAGLEERQLYGLGFRPSSDGLECLLVEAIRSGSLLDRWNHRVVEPSPEDLMEEALGDGPERKPAQEEGGDAAPAEGGDVGAEKRAEAAHSGHFQQVFPGAAIVAVNDAAADVGMMQLQLTKPKVTLWIRSDVTHPSQITSEVWQASEFEQPTGFSNAAPGGTTTGPSEQGAPANPSAPEPTFLGRPMGPAAEIGGAVQALFGQSGGLAGPRVACMAFEDEEPQILLRWTVCSIIFGWVTMLPVLLMQPHEERPRQQLLRQYLLKPCLLVLPFWILLWLLDCIQVLFQFKIVPPFYFFSICHMIFPAILVWYLMQMQVADERLVLDQRKARQAEAGGSFPVVSEDPCPTLLRELISINPVALVLLGSSAAAPLLVVSLLTPLQTKRGKLAQGYVNLIYAPCVFLQVVFGWTIQHIRFIDLPRVYLASIGLLLSVPCFAVWCLCIVCASRYGRQDLALVERQRRTRAKEAAGPAAQFATASHESAASIAEAGEAPSTASPEAELIDCTEAVHREFELIYTA